MLATIEKQSKHVYICISGHAPTEAALASEKEGFYDALHSNLRGMQSAYPSALVVCCLDANGTVGQTKANGIGECQPELETANGALLRNFLTEFHLYAVNTYFQAGPTWVSGHGNSRRIDYIITCNKIHCNITESFTDKELEIGTTAKIDHYVVAAEFEQPLRDNQHIAKHSKAANTCSIDINSVKDTCKVEKFITELCYFDTRGEDVDHMLHNACSHIRTAARKTFGSAKNTPRKPWISQDTWQMLQHVAPMRRKLAKVKASLSRAVLGNAFYKWMLLITQPFHPGQIARLGWGAAEKAASATKCMYDIYHNIAILHKGISHLHWFVKHSVDIDRSAFLHKQAWKAQCAAVSGNIKASFRIAKSLGSFKPRAMQSVKKLDGTTANNAEEASARWQEHFCTLFSGSIAICDESLSSRPQAEEAKSCLFLHPPTVRDLGSETGQWAGVENCDFSMIQGAEGANPQGARNVTPQAPGVTNRDPSGPNGPNTSNFKPTVHQVHQCLMNLANGKAVGQDGIAAEILKAGGWQCACIIHSIINNIAINRYVPVNWKGGRIVDTKISIKCNTE